MDGETLSDTLVDSEELGLIDDETVSDALIDGEKLLRHTY